MPLGLPRSSMSWNLPWGRQSGQVYSVIFNKTSVQVPTPFNHGTDLIMKTAGGVKSTLEDMVTF